MRFSTVSSLLIAGLPLATSLPATSTPSLGDIESPGSGPYPANWFTDASLSNHTIYSPVSVPPGVSLPVLVWAEGGCDNNGTKYVPFLTNIASYGFLVLASGPPNGSGSTTAQFMADAVEWITARAGTPGPYASVNPTFIAAAGQSCGGLETYRMRSNDQISILGIFNSGFLGNETFTPSVGGQATEPPATIKEVHKPVFYFLGGPTDIAYANGEADYHSLKGVPKWIGNYPVGHSGTYHDENGGVFGVAAVNWLQWTFRRNETAAGFFTKGGAQKDGWEEVESEGLEKLFASIPSKRMK
ncbi:hypothetical protein ANOM_001646 [Aspergillus nomiae NRRL 13137]|uniref:Alpha/beta-hydrolase n=1 Tax=Aspergillus nomiae NRRL (strain ATCC 15546 / NRRL 13137 / CBS 260.88 / M93) TaxID=1509407 RepID=A0A0L1JBY3_ASPN3|nr:uncharacterized protein ANOM_001646 [Aspergillus nomiae NRRL 13137]KNG89281.1 hypothetical protein ANOM_001646 [Aspergillus nomiae NRRL 13137]